MSGTLAAVTALVVGAIRAGRRALVRSTFDLAADFAQAEATGARRYFVQQLKRVDLLVFHCCCGCPCYCGRPRKYKRSVRGFETRS